MSEMKTTETLLERTEFDQSRRLCRQQSHRRHLLPQQHHHLRAHRLQIQQLPHLLGLCVHRRRRICLSDGKNTKVRLL